MAKLTGKAKQEFLARINKGRVKAGLKKIGSKTKSVVKRKSNKARSTSNNVAKQKSKPKRKQSTAMKLYDKKNIKVIAIKAGIGTATGIVIRLATMFHSNPTVREAGSRGANIVSSLTGGGSGNAGYQAADALVSRAILQRFNGNGRSGVTVPNPLLGVA